MIPPGYPPELDTANPDLGHVTEGSTTGPVEKVPFQHRMENIDILDPRDEPGVNQRRVIGHRHVRAFLEGGKPLIFMDMTTKTFHLEDGTELPFEDLSPHVQDQVVEYGKGEAKRAAAWKAYYDRVGYPAFPTEIANPGHYHTPPEAPEPLAEETSELPPAPGVDQTAETLHGNPGDLSGPVSHDPDVEVVETRTSNGTEDPAPAALPCPICAFRGEVRMYPDEATFVAHMESHRDGK